MAKKIWIYQADRVLSNAEVKKVEGAVSKFIEGWEAHGKKLQANFRIESNTFLLIRVDETGQEATGCSIDSSVGFLRELQRLGIDFLNRSIIAYEIEGKLQFAERMEFMNKVKAGLIPIDALVYNNTITSEDQLDDWKKPLDQSWASRWVPQSTSS